MAGYMVDSLDVFNKFIEDVNKRNDRQQRGRFMRGLLAVLDYIGDKLGRINAPQYNARVKAMVDTLNDLINDVYAKQKDAEVMDTTKTTEASDPKHSLIGEIGASALDMAEEATTRLDNLAVAREMETAGKDVKAIRMATGWERGADGLWRYEIMDAEVNLYDGDENTIRKKIEVAEEEEKDFMRQSKADTKELRERTNSYLAEMREKYGVAEGEETDVMTEEEITQLQSLTNKEIEFEDYKERRRNELYNRRMALEAQLGYVRVKNTDASAMTLSTRLGHILLGNDAEVLFAAHPSLRDIEVQFVTDIRDGAFAAYATKGGYKRIELNAKKTPVDMLAPYILHEVQHAIQDIEGFAGGGNLSSLQSDENVSAEEAYDYYHKIAGEVEARNVSARINMTPEERRTTLLSETEDVAREDQIFLREGAEMAMAQPKSSLSEETTKIFDAAKAKFGTTYDMREAGYILPDGSMLDFSGRHQERGGDTSFLNGDRTVDHRKISDIAYDADDNETGIKTDLGDFLDRGAIRIDSNAGAINLNVAPTKVQKDRLKRLIERNDGYVYVDFGKGWDTEHYAEYEAARASRVLGDIDRYFDEGIKPTGNVRFSLQETNDRFNAELDAFKAGTHKGLLHLGYPSEILKVCGVGARELTISPRELSRHLKKHNLTTDDIKDLVYAIQEPIMVYKHGKKHPNIVVITEVMVNNGKLSVSIELDDKGNVVEISNISSVHSKDALTELDRLSELSDEELKKALKWVDKEKVSGWLMPTPYMGSGASLDPKHLSTANIIQNFQNPKIEPRNSLITPEMDTSYLDAVERGDMETAQKMVMEAAKLAMPNTKVVNEDGNPKVVYHGGQFGISSFIPKRNMHFGTKKAAMQRILDEQWGYDNWLVQNEDGSYSWKYEDEYDEANNVQSNKTFATEEEAMEDALLYLGNEVVVKPYFLNIRNIERTDDAQSSWDDTIEVVKAENDNVDGIIYENWYEDKGADSYVAFNPNQIKSADPVTYDDAGNVIPLSERFNPEKEDVRYSLSEEDARFERKTAFLKGLMREYNIPLPTFIAQTKEEFVRMVQDYFSLTDEEVEEAREVVEKMVGSYDPDNEIILINGGNIHGKEQLSGCVRHEFGHHLTKKHLLEDIRQVAKALGDDALKRAQQEFLKGHSYEALGAEGVVNELVSYLSETPKIQEIISIFEGNLGVDEFIGRLQTRIEARNDLKEKDVYIALLPLTKKNIELQKQQYGAEKENIIIIPRADSSGRGDSISKGGSSSSHNKGIGGTQARSTEANRRGESADAQEVETRYSMPSGKGVDLDMPFIDDEGNVVETMPVRRARNVYAQMEERIERNHQTTLRKIAKDAEEARKVAGQRYREEKAKRRAAVQGMRGNAAKVAYILGDNAVETLPYEIQAMVMIANGLKVRWEDSTTPSGAIRRGLGSELGLRASKGDRRSTT